MVNETEAIEIVGQPTTEADIFTMIGQIITNPIVLVIIGIVVGAIIVWIFYAYIWKKEDKLIFEFEKFEDITIGDLKKTFKTEGVRSESKIIHGFKNPLGKVEKYLQRKGEWNVLVFNKSKNEYEPKTIAIKIERKDKEGKIVKDKAGKIEYDIKTEPLKIPYDLYIFRIKGEGWFEEPKFIIADNEFVGYDPKSNTWTISDNAQLKLFGNAWITSDRGEQYLQDISFRRSLENNLTFLMNQSRKVIFLETSFAQKHELLLGKGIAKKLAYDQYAQNVLIEAGKVGGEEEDET